MSALPAGFFDRPFAHRALHGPGRPENGLSAIRAAVAAGYGIEVDIQLSADGRAMVFHDATLDRMTDRKGAVSARPADELSSIPLLGTGDRIPTLAAALAEIGGRVPVVLEIKDQTGMFGPTDGMLEGAVARDLVGYAGPVAVMSFNPHSVAQMRTLAGDVPRGLTTDAFAEDEMPVLSAEQRRALAGMEMLETVGAAFISHDSKDLDSAAVAKARAHGLPVLCWTIRSQAAADRALKIADQITFEGFTPA